MRAGVAMLLLAVMVIGCVAGALSQYGVAMTGNAKCGMEEHQHTAECYTSVLTCGREEDPGHIHSDECLYQEELVCGLEEGEDHVHTEACRVTPEGYACGEEEREAHFHDDSCYTAELACGKEEHIHTDVCYMDANADVETEEVWAKQYAGIQWKGIWGEDLAMAAAMQLGYKESIENFTVAEDGSRKGYTRYGAFAGDPYGNWDAAFVSFCLHYAGIQSKDAETPVFPKVADSAKWCEEFGKMSEGNSAFLTGPEGYVPAAGDLIFSQRENEETAVQMGIVASFDQEKNEIHVIEGNSQNEVKENIYPLGEAHIVRFLKLTELEAACKAAAEVPAEQDPAGPAETEEGGKIFTTEDPEGQEDPAGTEDPANPETPAGTETPEEPTVELTTVVDGTTITLSGPQSSFEEGKEYSIQASKVEDEKVIATIEEAIAPLEDPNAAPIATAEKAEPAAPAEDPTAAPEETAAPEQNPAEVPEETTAAPVESAAPEVALAAETAAPEEITASAAEEPTAAPEETVAPEAPVAQSENSAEEPAQSGESAAAAEESVQPTKQIKDYQAFDIKLLADGEEVQPIGPVSVKFSSQEVTESVEDEETEVKVIHVDETTGTATDMEAIATEEKDVVIETEHFSVYVYVHLTKIYGTINVTVEHWGKNLKVIDGEANVEKGTDTVFVANKDNPYVKTKTVKARIYSKDTIEIPNEYYEDVAQLSKICNTNVKQKNYTVSEIWVCKSSQINNNKGRENDATWVSGSYTVYKPGDNKRIDLSADSLIRFWYTPVTGDNKLATDATFYDYDITDGKKYNDAGTETSGGKYVKTQGQGINSSFVSSTTENRLTIGQYASGNRTACAGTPNANNEVTGGGKLYGLYLNRGNGKFANGNSKVVQGIVKDDLTSPNGNLKYNVTVPKNLFKSATNEGSTKYTRYQLRFKQSGDTYTLDNVYNKNTKKIAKGGGGPNGKGLSTFGNFSGALSNNFWPMDDIGERNGHDPFMGVKANEWYFLKNNNKLGTWGSQSASDDNSDHNWHFGMTYTINFTVGDYTGPMEYYFRGDDDFWLFIDGTKVVDIGGIHSAVGHSVDLREWMKKKGMLADKTKEHTLKVFYMERGGFGSCCYMQFTIPNSEPVPVSTPDTETYTVRKEWADSDNWFRPGSIKVELQQKLNGTVTGTSEEIILSAANGWEYTWEDLPKKPGNTTQNYNYVYEAKEIDLPDGYYSKIVNGVLTNTLDPVKIKVQKNWINDEGLESSYRPDSVTMQLYYKTKETDQEQPYQDRTGKTRTITLNASNNWTAEFVIFQYYRAKIIG